MTHEKFLNDDWAGIVERLGGDAWLAASARETKALTRARGIRNATDLLRLILAYCLGEMGLRLTAAWASSINLANISNVGLFYRLRQSSLWLEVLIGRLLEADTPASAKGRFLRLIDGTTVPKKGAKGRRSNALWRIHGAFDLPAERFGKLELTDEKGGERLDRIPAVSGEIRIADRAFMQPDRMAPILDAGADFIVRSPWKGAQWLEADGSQLDIIGLFKKTQNADIIDRPIQVGRKKGQPLALRLVAVRKPPEACETARRKAREAARKGGHTVSQSTLIAADWVILVTSLPETAFKAEDVLALYRLRWRIELAFKRLKSIVGLKGPPSVDERSARAFVLAHLLMILLLEPLVDEFGDSPPRARSTITA
jgi:hypothetical protein